VEAGPVWADKDFLADKALAATAKWNEIDGKINRRSFEGIYKLDEFGVPQNPLGRTGMRGRGLLGRFGPNHAADPIVTRWKRSDDGKVLEKEGKKVLEFVCIERTDGGGWAIPGGMVDPGESVSLTLKREFGEEALNSEGVSAAEKAHIEEQVATLFKGGVEVFAGYVDDPRNTDNAWMETVAMNFHDESGDVFGKFKLHAGDDAGKVKWMEVSGDIKLYASHATFIKNTCDRLGAHW
jgi:ADP-ribose pyrophosphatase